MGTEWKNDLLGLQTLDRKMMVQAGIIMGEPAEKQQWIERQEKLAAGLQAAKAAHLDCLRQIKDIELKAGSEHARLKKFTDKAQQGLKSAEDYAKAEIQIAESRKITAELEEQELKLMEQEIALKAALADAELQAKTEGVAIQAALDEISKRTAAARAELELLKPQRPALLAKLPQDIGGVYDRIFRHRLQNPQTHAKPAAVPLLYGKECGCCGMEQVSQTIVNVKRGNPPTVCEYCGTLLYPE